MRNDEGGIVKDGERFRRKKEEGTTIQ